MSDKKKDIKKQVKKGTGTESTTILGKKVENKDSDLCKELRDFAFNAKAGDLSPVIETEGAVFLVKVEALEQARVRPLTEVRDDVEATLKGVERERLRKKWINKLRTKAFIRYF